MNPLPENLQNLIIAATEMRKDPRYDKKWLNKTISRMEDALAFSEKIVKPGVEADQASLNSTAPTGLRPDSCTCIYDSQNQSKLVAKDANCPVHK